MIDEEMTVEKERMEEIEVAHRDIPIEWKEMAR